MNAPDTNLLLYPHNRQSPFHLRARAYWQNALNGRDPIGIPALCVHGFLRIVTNSAFGASCLEIAEALAIVDGWLAQPHVSILNPGPRHWQLLRNLALHVESRSMTDAAIAATAIEHSAVVHTNDRDFARFPGLRWHNPLESK